MSYADFDDDFQQADLPETYAEAPCGTYQCEIVEFKDETTKTGIPKLNCLLRVIAGEHDGKVLYKGWLLTAEAMSYIKADFMKFGLPVETTKFSRLRNMLDSDVVGKWCEVVKKQNKKDPEYTNVYINSMITPVGNPQAAPTQTAPAPPQSPVDHYADAKEVAAAKSGDDIPF